MKNSVLIWLLLFGFFNSAKTQQTVSPDFSWGNAHYFNLNLGESVVFQDTDLARHEDEDAAFPLTLADDEVAGVAVEQRCRVEQFVDLVLVDQRLQRLPQS